MTRYLALCDAAGVSWQTGVGAPRRLLCDGHAPHAHCAPGRLGLSHAEPLRMVHWPLRGSQGAPSLAHAKSVVAEQDVLRKVPDGHVGLARHLYRRGRPCARRRRP